MNSTIDRAAPATPSLTAFEKQAELAREALQNFNSIRTLSNAPGPTKAALTELVNSTVRMLFFSE